ncbi:CRISPR system precrRNA processing endoribonuclease RAMP protein Cas6 [soil metagenome]
MNLPELSLLFLTFRLQARKSVTLPPFLGSTLRGAFGTALKQVFCFVPHGKCERCWFFEACPYQYIFESPNLIPNAENHPKLRGQKNLPHPFVMIPPVPKLKNRPKTVSAGKPNFNDDYAENHIAGGEILEFSIMLIGKATAFWAQILAAAQLSAENGLGKNRVPFDLLQAFTHDRNGNPVEIFNAREMRVSVKNVEPVSLVSAVNLHTELLKNQCHGSEPKHLKIEFLTPARIRIGDEIKPEIEAFELLKKITERIEFLALIHAVTSQAVDYREFIENAGKMLNLDGDIKIYRYEQFSNRQNKKTSRDVMMAEMALSGSNLTNILPLLSAGEFLHVGANTSDGFGRYSFKILN